MHRSFLLPVWGACAATVGEGFNPPVHRTTVPQWVSGVQGAETAPLKYYYENNTESLTRNRKNKCHSIHTPDNPDHFLCTYSPQHL